MANDDASGIVRDFDRASPRSQQKDLRDDEKLAYVARAPNRMWIEDLDDASDGSNVVAQYNPSEFEEVLKVDWTKLKPPGLSHRPLQYTGTENAELSFDLTFDALVDGMTADKLLRSRSFLRSLCYPRRGATSVREGQAPRALFVWPHFLSITCVLNELNFKYERFDLSGALTRYTARVKIEAINVTEERLYLEDVREGR